MKNLSTVLDYHNRTKHHSHRYAASLGYMDWETQPNPFRSYRDVQNIPLVFSHIDPPYHLLFEPNALPQAPTCLESLSHLLRYSLGLAAWKQQGNSSWALRCNASSGNLHPTECYVIAPPTPGLSDSYTLSHYAPKAHALEILHTFDAPIEGMGENGYLVILSSVIWREAWKYGERCWRYCQLDAGHAQEALRLSAKSLGWNSTLLSVDTSALATLCGLDQFDRFHPDERESADMMLWISPKEAPNSLILPSTPNLTSVANVLSPDHHPWPILAVIDEATQGTYIPDSMMDTKRITPNPSRGSAEIFLKRRSAQAMDGSSITKEQFAQLLDSCDDLQDTTDVHFVLFVHRVIGMESGLYLLTRNRNELTDLRASLSPDYAWQPQDILDNRLFLLRAGDYRGAAKMISCNQDIAKESAFSMGMLCRFAPTLEEHGSVAYKHLYHECGALGQMLYCEATTMGLSATGIGCFLDDEMHRLLGITNERYQSLYHFTIGRAIVDTRLATLEPYAHLHPFV
ncbi:MAG: SagB/ThcOx family dehydrogenase [Sulfuricurvum sp.]|nr:SagB/ThcOx family dehydrogenase [Sulfuricurvum sp.]